MSYVRPASSRDTVTVRITAAQTEDFRFVTPATCHGLRWRVCAPIRQCHRVTVRIGHEVRGRAGTRRWRDELIQCPCWTLIALVVGTSGPMC